MSLAAPSHLGKLHFVASRAIHRDIELLDLSDIGHIADVPTTFAKVITRTTLARTVISVLQVALESSGDAANAGEEDLCCALNTVIRSLHALGGIYKRWEMRWIKENNNMLDDDEKERVQLLLSAAQCCSDRCRQVLGVSIVCDLV
jgi:hypothetical protein